MRKNDTREEKRLRRGRLIFRIVVLVWLAFVLWILLRATASASELYDLEDLTIVRKDPPPEIAGELLGECRITYYCAEEYRHICNAGPPFVTAKGTKLKPGVTCAADDLPLGTVLLIDFDDDGVADEERIVEDRFGGKQKMHLDLCVATHAEALKLGRRTAVVYLKGETEQNDRDQSNSVRGDPPARARSLIGTAGVAGERVHASRALRRQITRPGAREAYRGSPGRP